MKQSPFGLALAAILYGAISLTANAVGAEDLSVAGLSSQELSTADRADLKALRSGDMLKLVVHAKPRDRINETFRDLHGNPITLADYSGKVVLLNFWATWCAPCRKEMPLLDDLHRRMAEQSGRVIAISVDRDGERVARFLEENDLSLPVFVDGPEGLIKELDLDHLPYTFVLDTSGRIVFQGSAAGSEKWAKMTGVVNRLLVDATTSRSPEKAEKAES
jgi:thiol-disulfide isomerase/thioredoxin